MTDSTVSYKRCRHCGGLHEGMCPRVKSVSYADGKITHIEYHDHLPRLDAPETDKPPEDSLNLSHGGTD